MYFYWLRNWPQWTRDIHYDISEQCQAHFRRWSVSWNCQIFVIYKLQYMSSWNLCPLAQFFLGATNLRILGCIESFSYPKKKNRDSSFCRSQFGFPEKNLLLLLLDPFFLQKEEKNASSIKMAAEDSVRLKKGRDFSYLYWIREVKACFVHGSTTFLQQQEQLWLCGHLERRRAAPRKIMLQNYIILCVLFLLLLLLPPTLSLDFFWCVFIGTGTDEYA